MIWLTWRQHRRAFIVLGVALVALAIYLVVIGHNMYTAYTHVSHGLSPALCDQQYSNNQYSNSGVCANLLQNFLDDYLFDQRELAVMLALPPLLGMFLGAPLIARELETGTFRLAWMQSITRRRWLLARVGTIVGVVTLALAALTPLTFWRQGPFGFTGGDIVRGTYLMVGIIPLAYSAFALALGIAAGTLLRRVIPAMFVTLAVYFGVLLAISNWVRPYWLPPLRVTWDSSRVWGPTGTSGSDWTLFAGYIDQSGRQIDFGAVLQTCAPDGFMDERPNSPFTNCVHAHGWLDQIVYQPSDRFWPFQGIESGVLLILAALLILLSIYWVRRRLN